MDKSHLSFWQIVWKRFSRHKLGLCALFLVAGFVLLAIYAPLLASSKPLVVQFQGTWYFPLFRYLFYPEFFTKKLDIFYNLLMFTFPLFIAVGIGLQRFPHLRFKCLCGCIFLHLSLFLFLILYPPKNPEKNTLPPSTSNLAWNQELQTLTPYAQLNLVLRYQQYLLQHQRLLVFEKQYDAQAKKRGLTEPLFPSLWNLTYAQEEKREPSSAELQARRAWLNSQLKEIHYQIMPLLRPFHWEDDAGGDEGLNHFVSWWDLTRINRKDMVSALIFGTRISLSVGFLAIGFALLIGVPIGACAGYYGGKWDLIVYRLIEIWESMPTFFMLLMVVAFLQSKSIFLVIAVIGLFGWTGFSRFIRGEFFRQKELLYVEACHAMGYSDRRIIFSHLLPNAIPPLLTLVPFAIMGAITSEAGLSFLGLGEEGSNSWGILMDEGRSAFPSESYLLWPPAILLTMLLVSIALIGDSLRDALDPRAN